MQLQKSIIYRSAAIIAAGLAIRIPGLLFPIWYDEKFTRLVALLPLRRLIDATAGDVHPPTWYIISKLFANGPDWLIRLPALLAWVAGAGILVLILRDLAYPAAVRYSVIILFAFMPMQLWYSTEARVYAALQLAVLIGYYSILNPRKRLILLALSLSALLWLHNWGLFYAATLGVIGLYRAGKDYLGVILAGAVALITWIPWVSVLLSQMQQIGGGYWLTVDRLLPGLILYTIIQQFIGPSLSTLPGILIIICALLLGFYKGFRDDKQIVFMALFPVALGIAVSLLWNPVILYRAMIGISPFLYILVSLPLASLPPLPRSSAIRRGLILSIFILPVLVYGIGSYLLFGTELKQDYSYRVINYIGANARPGDIIINVNDGTAVMLAGADLNIPQYKLMDCGHTPGELTQNTRDALGFITADLSNIEFTRAWVVWSIGPFTPACELEYLYKILPPTPVILAWESDIVYFGLWILEKP